MPVEQLTNYDLIISINTGKLACAALVPARLERLQPHAPTRALAQFFLPHQSHQAAADMVSWSRSEARLGTEPNGQVVTKPGATLHALIPSSSLEPLDISSRGLLAEGEGKWFASRQS